MKSVATITITISSLYLSLVSSPPPCTIQCILHRNDPLIVPSQRTIGIIHTTDSRHATGLPNPSADYILVDIGEVRGHDPRRRGASYVSLQIVRVEFDLPTTYSGDGSCNDRRGVVSSGGMGGACRSILGGGGDGILAVPEIESSLPCLFGAPLVATKFSPRVMRDAKASPDGSIGTPFVAATFHLRAVRDANASLDGSVGAPLDAATSSPRAVRDAKTARLAHQLLLQRFTFALCVMQMPPFLDLFAHPSWLHCFIFAPCVTQKPPLTAPLAHPSWLHCFLVAPCVTQTPPFRACSAHPL